MSFSRKGPLGRKGRHQQAASWWPNVKITERICRGQGRLEDLKILDEIGKSIGIMPGTTICGLADGAGWPVKNAIQKFREELEASIRSGERSQGLALVGTH